jgi:hypothetical protein
LSPPLQNVEATPTSALSLEQEIFSKSQSQSQPIISSISSTASKPVKLSSLQRALQHSQLYYQSLSQSSDSQVEIIDEEDDFDDFFSSTPVIETRKKKNEPTKSQSWTQTIAPLKSRNVSEIVY